MTVGNTGGVENTPRVNEVQKSRPATRAYESAPTSAPREVDKSEISEEARLLQKVSSAPAVREEKIAELKRLIESGEYDTPERIQGTVDKIIEDDGI